MGLDLHHILRPETEDRTNRQKQEKETQVHRDFNL